MIYPHFPVPDPISLSVCIRWASGASFEGLGSRRPPKEKEKTMALRNFKKIAPQEKVEMTPLVGLTGGWGPLLPQDFQNNTHFIGFIDSMFHMYYMYIDALNIVP